MRPLSTTHECRCCGDPASFYNSLADWLCPECAAEILKGIVPPAESITGHPMAHVPTDVRVVRRNRQPGTREGNDYFGNHT